nr:MAG TPA: hypothetical protein [Caudoviricetes sp.]
MQRKTARDASQTPSPSSCKKMVPASIHTGRDRLRFLSLAGSLPASALADPSVDRLFFPSANLPGRRVDDRVRLGQHALENIRFDRVDREAGFFGDRADSHIHACHWLLLVFDADDIRGDIRGLQDQRCLRDGHPVGRQRKQLAPVRLERLIVVLSQVGSQLQWLSRLRFIPVRWVGEIVDEIEKVIFQSSDSHVRHDRIKRLGLPSLPRPDRSFGDIKDFRELAPRQPKPLASCPNSRGR